MVAPKQRKTERTVTFEVKTVHPLPVGQQVFIAGDSKVLGNWRPDGLPLTRMGENLWSGYAILPVGDTVEYKITLGDWENEALDENGAVPGNHVLKPGGDITVRHVVTAWKSGRS
ncbi:MAG: CBM20 domain-containing protein [Kiritimatiellae bacterium]|nr:CBM20 domain-containing protein [Kiritimatiellia bacterium]MDW8458730.1 CBM20 domain-containing protein [Verrucomicrobiota bacterium]